MVFTLLCVIGVFAVTYLGACILWAFTSWHMARDIANPLLKKMFLDEARTSYKWPIYFVRDIKAVPL